MNGWIPPSRKLSGVARKRKNYSIWQKYSQTNGAQLHHLSVALQLNASKSTKLFSIELWIAKPTHQILEDCALVRLIRIQKQNLVAPTQSTWTKTRRRCCRSAVLDSPIPKVKKPSVRHAKSNLKKPAASLSYKNNVNWSKPVLMCIGLKRLKEPITMLRFLSLLRFL